MKKIILLYPGGFKPFHDGHLSMLESHISNIDKFYINEVDIIISNKSRDNLTAETTSWFLNILKKNIEIYYNVKINVIISDIPSPIGKCYSIVNNDIDGNLYCLITSNKDNDLIRKLDFVHNYQKDGKYYNNETGEKTVFINADIEPVIYKYRDDEYNNENISSTIIRNDIKNNSYKLFRTGYMNMLSKQYITENILKLYFKKLLKEIS